MNLIRIPNVKHRLYFAQRTARPLLVLALLTVTTLHGCGDDGAFRLEGFEADTVEVPAEYEGLANHRVAVLVNAPVEIMFRYPQAQLEVCSIVSELIAARVPGVAVVDPRTVVDFQRRNIYWSTATYAELGEYLDVSRLVLIDLGAYTTRASGDPNLYRGLISASVAVAEMDSPTPNDLVYRTEITQFYPKKQPAGVLDANETAIRKGMLDLFALATVHRFVDYEVER